MDARLTGVITYKGLAISLGLGIAALPLAACSFGSSDGNANHDSSGTTSLDVPPIYVAQTIVFLLDGHPMIEGQYRSALDTCRKVGATTTPLSDEDAGKIGRTYYQLWFDTKRSAYQEDQWNYDLIGNGVTLCRFVVKHESNRFVTTKSKIYEIDLIANTVAS